MIRDRVSQSKNNVSGDMAGNDIIKNTYNIGNPTPRGKSQLERLYEKLEKERESSNVFSEIVDELLHFKQSADEKEFIGLEKKLENGNRMSYLNFAERSKEKFAKKLLLNEHSETAQYIYAFLLAKVYSSFEINVAPRIKESHPEAFINELVNQFIIHPLEEILGDNLLRIYEDELNGMIYFLTGNCHIKWD